MSRLLDALIGSTPVVVESIPRLGRGLTGSARSPGPLAILVTVFLVLFVGCFFDVAVAGCAVRSLRGEDVGAVAGVVAAARRSGSILGCTVILGTVGPFLTVTRSRLSSPDVERWITGATWKVATFLVVPVMVCEGSTRGAARRRSIELVEATWGENAIATGTISTLSDLVAWPLAVGGGVGVFVVCGRGYSTPWLVAAVGCRAAGVVVSVVASALDVIFRVAVYLHLATGEVLCAFDPAVMRGSFGQGWCRRTALVAASDETGWPANRVASCPR